MMGGVAVVPPSSSALPAVAAWRHVAAREGFEVTTFTVAGSDLVIEGSTSAVEDGEPWAVRYTITVDEHWRTRRASVAGLARRGRRDVTLAADGEGRWHIDGRPAPELDGCLDVDLESSACTNTLPIHRLALGVGEPAAAPAAYVHATDLGVIRLDQDYVRLASGDHDQRYRYRAPMFEYDDELVFDETGLTLTYPGLAGRVL